MRQRFYQLGFIVLLGLCFCTASADGGPPSTAGWELRPDFSDGMARIQLEINNMEQLRAYNGPVGKVWGDMGPNPDPGKRIPIPESGGCLILGLELIVDADPMVTLNFNVQAGQNATNFLIVSPLVSFAPIAAEGTATAAITVTDTDGNGGTAAGQLGSKFYEGKYNSSGWTNFGTLVYGPVTAPPYGSTTASETKPPWQAMGTAYDMQSAFQFGVSANDSVSGTSNFVVRAVPEPNSAVALFALLTGTGGLALRRRRH